MVILRLKEKEMKDDHNTTRDRNTTKIYITILFSHAKRTFINNSIALLLRFDTLKIVQCSGIASFIETYTSPSCMH